MAARPPGPRARRIPDARRAAPCPANPHLPASGTLPLSPARPPQSARDLAASNFPPVASVAARWDGSIIRLCEMLARELSARFDQTLYNSKDTTAWYDKVYQRRIRTSYQTHDTDQQHYPPSDVDQLA